MAGGPNHGRLDAGWLRTASTSLRLPRREGGRLVLAVDVSPWLRSDAPFSPDHPLCHVYGRAQTASLFVACPLHSFTTVEPEAPRGRSGQALSRCTADVPRSAHANGAESGTGGASARVADGRDGTGTSWYVADGEGGEGGRPVAVAVCVEAPSSRWAVSTPLLYPGSMAASIS